MSRSRRQLGLSRRVVSCYLLFCAIAVTWLAVGVVITAHTILASRTESSSLQQIGRWSSDIELRLLQGGGPEIGPLLDCMRREGQFSYCGVVATDGSIIAHTQSNQIGKTLPERLGQRLQWGSVLGLRFVDESGDVVNEYRTPLVTGNKPIGQLVVATPATSLWGTLRSTAHVAPLAILAPLILIGLGAMFLRRMTHSAGAIDGQLANLTTLASGELPQLQTVPATNASSLGWNRLVETLTQFKTEPRTSVDDRLQEAMENRRQQKDNVVLDSLAEGIAVTNAEGRITFANRALAALLDQETTPRDATLLDYLSAATDDAKSLSALLDTPTTRPALAELRHEAGSQQRVLRVSRGPLRDGDSRGCVWNVRDVTQQKLADAMRDQFIDSATHELRTPLSNIKAYAETLASSDSIDVAEQKEFCNIINSEATRLARFVDDLLCVSSMEVGSLSIHRQQVDLARLFDEIVEKARPSMTKKNIEFQAVLPARLPEAMLDKDKLSAMLVNLLGNAAKYTPAGGEVTLQVKVNDARLEMAVADTGYGIAPDDLNKVFEKFYRSTDPRVVAENGTGLGLPLAREIVRLHGGDLTVESKLNEGSTFRAVIPLQEGVSR